MKARSILLAVALSCGLVTLSEAKTTRRVVANSNSKSVAAARKRAKKQAKARQKTVRKAMKRKPAMRKPVKH
jgi:hypothetical protein